MRKRAWFVGIVLLCLALAAPILGAPKKGSKVTVRVLKAKVMAEPKFIARGVVEVSRGEQLTFQEAKGDWYRVATQDGKTGWMHRSHVVDKAVELSSKPGKTGRGASDEEVELAGRGFTPEVEEEYRSKHPELDFEHVDSIEALAVDPDEVAAFVKEGKLGGGR